MKKVLLFLVLAGLGFSASAQMLSFGIKAGANYGTVSHYNNIDFPGAVQSTIEGSGDNSYRFGFYAGIYGNYSIGFFAFQPELLYSNQGMKNKGHIESLDVDYSSTLKLDYLNIPLIVQFYLIQDLLYIEAGPQVGFMLGARNKFELDTRIDGFDIDKTWKVKDNYNTVDFSIAVGAGFKIPVVPVGVNVRYTFGLTEVAKNSNNDKKTVNSLLQFGAFWMF